MSLQKVEMKKKNQYFRRSSSTNLKKIYMLMQEKKAPDLDAKNLVQLICYRSGKLQQ